MGTVYRATHTILPRSAAIKVLHADMIGTHSAVERMLQEARILEALDHPTAIKVYDAGVLPDGRPWVAMELVEGQTLADHLLVNGRLNATEAAQIIRLLADALSRAHRDGVVHRDVKPDNIMLVPGTKGLEVKLLDWGIAHVNSMVLARRLTQQDYSPGTPCYMSPEQLRGEHVDGRSDTYALGVVAYEMLTGVPPFDGDNHIDVAIKTLHSPVPPLASHKVVVPREIEAVVLAMLAKHTVDRPSLDDVATTFGNWSVGLTASDVDESAYVSISIEMEIDMDDEGGAVRERCVIGEITC